MNVFLTGATGYIGSEVAMRLRRAGHDVTALVRPSSDHSMLSGAGVATVTGDLGDLPRMRDTIRVHDVIIHTALASSDTAALDGEAIRTFLASTSSDGHFIYTSGVWVLARHRGESTEETAPAPLPLMAWRAEHERWVLDASRAGHTTTVIRPGCVYGGAQGLLQDWFSAAFRGDPVRVLEGGRNRWAMVHVKDLAALYVQAAEARIPGVLHGTDDTDATLCDLATSVAATAGSSPRIEIVSRDEASESLGPLVDGYLADQRVSSRITRERLGWKPVRRSFIDSLDAQWKEWRSSMDGNRAA